MKQPIEHLPLLLDVKEAARLLCIDPSTLERLEQKGEIGPSPVQLGGSILWKYEELQQWAAAGRPGELSTREQWTGKNTPTDTEPLACHATY